ncbi:MAG: HAMP domain-containing sensor histidine kinase [Anaerolineae bacterium]|nr:HAMP domain-containing histidine kinase [Anaerolineae bacterium]MDW8300231.1 HAMP domain-containing sensor histidine kinase [Anaerolineae bacterium]
MATTLSTKSAQNGDPSTFADQVRAERLSLLWKLTAGIVVLVFWVLLIVSTSAGLSRVGNLIVAGTLILIGCALTSFFLNRNLYKVAVWSYAGGLYIACALLLYAESVSSGQAASHLAALALPCVVLAVALLLPLGSALVGLGIGIAIALIVPNIGQPAFAISSIQLASVLLMIFTVGIAVQFTGEMYSITEWSLRSYQKERQLKDQLFDTQQEIQRSYMRQKALSEELQQANVALEAARAAEAEAKNFRGQFLANMSHELRTPLNAIIGFSETMLKYPMMYQNVPLPEPYRNDIQLIYNSGKTLLQLINDILDLAKIDAGRLDVIIENVSLEPIFNTVRATAASLLGSKPIKLEFDLPPEGLPEVLGDPLRVQQVLLNLTSNAVKFTQQGSITFGVRPQANGEALFWVRDTGIGIAPEDQETIFEEFRQGASGRRQGNTGSGLGLTITRHLLRLMQGRIWVESEVGKGSTFYFTLPMAQPEAQTQADQVSAS